MGRTRGYMWRYTGVYNRRACDKWSVNGGVAQNGQKTGMLLLIVQAHINANKITKRGSQRAPQSTQRPARAVGTYP